MGNKVKPTPPDTCCNARNRSGSLCKKPAGWGTDHKGSGRCRLHGGVVGENHGAPEGNQNAKKHGVYSRLFAQNELDAAVEMAGSIDTELAIARLQLARLLEQMQGQGDIAYLDAVEEKSIATNDDTEDQALKIKRARAKDAKRCGEHYDAADDDFGLPAEASATLERKKVYKRRDWSVEYNRLTALVARLETQRLAMDIRKAELEFIRKGKGSEDDSDILTDTQLDREILEITEGFTL